MNRQIILTIIVLLFSGILSAQTYLISDGGTINTCSGTVYDSGGASGNYSSNESHTLTICSDNGSPIVLDFTQFNTENSFDELIIYDGLNTGAPIIITADGSDLQGQTITSAGNCLTLFFDSDGSVQYAGFAATISCAMACQNYDLDITSTSPALTNADSMWIDVCQGTEITFNATGTYPNSGAEYDQNDGNTEFMWSVNNGGNPDVTSGVGMTSFSYTFDESGGYYLTLEGNDVNGCDNVNFEMIRIRVSISPSFDGTFLNPYTVCPGEEVTLNGVVTPISWSIPIPTEVAGTTYLPDGSGVEYTTSINHTVFGPTQTLESADDLLAICANIEHSYMGDLDIWIECPSGQIAYLFEQACSSGYFGEPIDGDSSPTPGVGYDYCWTMSAGSTMEDNCPGGSTSLPSGDYLPIDDFTSLVGCDMNGDWTIHILDNLGIDNGYIFSWQLIFDPSIIPDNLWSFVNTYDMGSTFWSGENIGVDSDGNAIATPETSGVLTYNFNAIDDFGCSYDTTLTVNVLPVDDPTCCSQPIADAGPDDQVCSNTYTLSASLTLPVNTVTWSQISGPGIANFNGQENSTNPTISVDAFGVYEFQLVEENLSPTCSDTDVVQISFYQTPTPTFTTTFVPCYGDVSTVTYTGNASPTATYNWGFDGGIGGGTGQGPYDLGWVDAGSHAITLTVEENGCVSSDTSITVLMPEEMTYTLTSEDDPCFQTCEGYAQIVVQGGTLPYNFSWGPTSVNQNLCEGDYAITVVDNNGCEISDNYTINQPPELVINSINTDDLSCNNSADGSISVNASGGFGALTYAWSDNEFGAVRNNLPAGNYGLTITCQNGCSVTDMVTLTQPDPLLVTISPDQAHCEGQMTTVSAQAIGGTQPYVYYWDSGNGFLPNTSDITVSPENTTNFIVYVEDGNGCQSAHASMTMTISPQMEMTLYTEDNRCYQNCDGSAELHISGGIPPFDYSWAASGAIYNDLCAGLYDVTITDRLGCQVDTVFYIDEPTQLFANVYTEDASCFGYEDGQAFVEVAGGEPEYSFLWPDGTINDTIALGAGLYEMTVSDANNCRLNVDVLINEPDELRAQLIGGDRWICKSNITQLNSQAIGGSPYYDFYWSGTDGTNYIVNDPSVSPETTTTYTLTVVDSHGCSSNMPDVTVNVHPDLMIESILTSYDSICPGSPAIVEVDVSGGNGGPYSLALQDGQVVPSPFTVYPMETTNYIVTLSDACGTPTVKDSVEIFVLPVPDNAFVSDKVEGCPPFIVSFNEVSEENGSSYLWGFGDDGFANVKNPTHVYEEGGWYPVTLTVTSEFGCEKTKTIDNMIHVFNKPLADFYTDQNFVSVLDPEIQFYNISNLADSSYWFFGDGDSSHFVNPSHNFTEIGEYNVQLVVETREGCLDTIIKVINVRDEFTFFAPTAFTPNGDGENDFFMVYGNGIDPNEFSLLVYDRWGELVYETDVYDLNRPVESAWDGTYQGNRTKGDALLHHGVYYWYCKFKDYTGVWHEEEGTVSLIR